MNKNKQYLSLNGLRAYGALGIILLHVASNLSYRYWKDFFTIIIPSFKDLVFMFMIISAFSMCCGYYEKIKNNQISIDVFYRKRFSKILPFFATVSLLDVLTSPSVKAIVEFVANSTLVFGLLPYPTFDVIGVGWFLGVIFVFYMVFPFFCYIIWNKKRAWLALGISLFYHISCQYIFFVDRVNFLYCSPFFVLGGLIYLYRDDIEKIFKHLFIRIICCILCVLICFKYYNGGNVFWLLGLFAILMVLAISKDNIILNNKFTKIISTNSLEMYLCHMIVFRVLILLGVKKIVGNIYLETFFIATLVAVGALMCSIVFNFIYNNLIRRIIKWQKKN